MGTLVERLRRWLNARPYYVKCILICKKDKIQGVPPICWQLRTKFWKLKNHICQKVSPVLKFLNKKLLDGTLKLGKIKFKVFLNWISKKSVKFPPKILPFDSTMRLLWELKLTLKVVVTSTEILCMNWFLIKISKVNLKSKKVFRFLFTLWAI